MGTVAYTVFDGEIVKENRAGTKRDYVPDSLGSTRALLDENQSVTDTWTYWPYGEIESRSGTADTSFTFVGTLGYYSGGAGGTYVRARWYSSVTCEWRTADPNWPLQHAYGYATSSPLTLIDPSGAAPILKGEISEACIHMVCSLKYSLKLINGLKSITKEIWNGVVTVVTNTYDIIDREVKHCGKDPVEVCIKKAKDRNDPLHDTIKDICTRYSPSLYDCACAIGEKEKICDSCCENTDWGITWGEGKCKDNCRNWQEVRQTKCKIIKPR